MDPLSDVLKLLNVESTLSARLEAGDRWAIRFRGYKHVKFCAVMAGSCWLTLDRTSEPILLEAGDCYLLSQEVPYRLASSLDGIEEVEAEAVFKEARDGVVRYGGTARTIIIGGGLTFDETNAPLLLGLLPPIIHVRGGSDPATILKCLLPLLAQENAAFQLGSCLMADRLAHILFIQVLRAYVASEAPSGWLGALADPKISHALRLMHGEVRRKWSLPELAAEVGMSRSSFAARFREYVGIAPLDYLKRWRMHLAAQALRDGNRPISSVAREAGYTFESAFSGAFKKVMGSSPHQYRTQSALRAPRPVTLNGYS